jgi:two-component system nitrate/nitrite response regulator NarL
MSNNLSTSLRVLLVDDHTLFRRGLSSLLGRDARIVVVGDAADAGEAQRRALELQPDLILLDNHLPGVTGVEAIRSLQEASPRARVVMLTVSEDALDMAGALRSGAAGYLLKTMDGDQLIDAMVRAAKGETVLASEMTGKLVSAYLGASSEPASLEPMACVSTALESLSGRERDILRGIARGASNKEIARELGIAEATVKIHVQGVLRKLNVSSRVQAAVVAVENGLA